ncbi:hypothetical protein [Haliea sp.]|uniref:hypothetical protein n=1 Tax=Haliea sp. TaxID=1932666 RepID=UPI0025BC5A9A|nr:hypothetical protein [Haliea sp.]
MAVVGFFYAVGKASSSGKKANDVARVRSGEGLDTEGIFVDQHQNEHSFNLLDSPAWIEWTPGVKAVRVRCRTRFSKGKAVTQTYRAYHYNFPEKHWYGDKPEGAVKACEAEIKKVVRL